jgi:hypothetical protein
VTALAARLAAHARAAVRRLDLDLRGRVVVTEAATGAYAVTPVLAALGRAREVRAVAAGGAHGTTAEIAAQLEALAAHAGVADRIELVTGKRAARLEDADVVTNSGHLRPLDARTIARMPPGAAIPLMYEAWELRDGDVDLDACRRHGIRVAGTNECHPAVDVFGYLGAMAVKLLADAGVAVYGSRLLVLCDNPFSPFIVRGLTAEGAEVVLDTRVGAIPPGCDALVVALRPRAGFVISSADARAIAAEAPGAVVAQYWGDVDRAALHACGVPVWPPAAPAAGHMGILPSAVGPEPTVRLQAAGLKVGELLTSGAPLRPADLDYLQPV